MMGRWPSTGHLTSQKAHPFKMGQLTNLLAVRGAAYGASQYNQDFMMSLFVSTFLMNGHPMVIVYKSAEYLAATLTPRNDFLGFIDAEDLEPSMASSVSKHGFSLRERTEFDGDHLPKMRFH